MSDRISLHGLGFVQVPLGPFRLHVWHPELPRRRCFEHSQVHDHRFGFESTVLVGTQFNVTYSIDGSGGGYVAYLHEGDRLPTGNRPWVRRGTLDIIHHDTEEVLAGETYRMRPYIFHKTVAGGDGRVATVMRKTVEHVTGARSLCRVGVEPHVDFDRHQVADSDLWDVVVDVLGGVPYFTGD